MTEPCVICGEPQSCPHLMRWHDNPKITPFIPGRGRIMEVPRGEEPAMYEVVLVGFPQPGLETDTIKNVTRFVPKRVVALEMASGGCKTVGVVLRDPDFPDPTMWGRRMDIGQGPWPGTLVLLDAEVREVRDD